MKTTQNNTEVKDAFRTGRMVDAEGKAFTFQLWMANRRTHWDVQVDIYRNEAVEANRVDGGKFMALSLDSARLAWKGYSEKLVAGYTVLEHTTHTLTVGGEQSKASFTAKSEGGIRKLVATFYDGNEGSYSVEADFAAMTLTEAGTACPDIPEEVKVLPVVVSGTTPVAHVLDSMFRAAVKTYTAQYILTGAESVAMNWVRTAWRAEA